MQISIKANLHLLTENLQKLEKQIDFIAAKALSDIAIDVQKATTRQLKKDLISPTPFTQRAIRYKRASKRNLQSMIYIARIQSEYLKFQIVGGSKRPKNRAIVIPKNIRLNKYGNMPRRKVQMLLAKHDTFSGTVKGIAGIWQRGVRSKKGRFSTTKVKRRNNVKLLAAYEPATQYNPHFNYYERARLTASKVIKLRINDAIRYAIATSR
jgi:hypothetical protein